jgi:hypothetical protein
LDDLSGGEGLSDDVGRKELGLELRVKLYGDMLACVVLGRILLRSVNERRGR